MSNQTSNEVADYWRSDASKSWTCIPGRLCGGAQFMRDARAEIEALQRGFDSAHAEVERLTAELERERRGWSASQQISELLAERDELRRWQHEARKIMLADGATDETKRLIYALLATSDEVRPARRPSC